MHEKLICLLFERILWFNEDLSMLSHIRFPLYSKALCVILQILTMLHQQRLNEDALKHTHLSCILSAMVLRVHREKSASS